MTALSSLQLDAERDLRVPVGVAKWPFFAVGPGVANTIFEGQRRGRRAYVHLMAKDPAIGVATVADIDVIAWASSAYTKILNSGRALPRTLELSPADFLRFCRRPSGGRQHVLLAASLERLANSVVSTNISPDDSLRAFDWIEAMQRPSSGRRFYEIHFGGWLQEAVEQRQIIKIAPDMLRFRGLQRRLYLWACAHAGNGSYSRYSLRFADAYRRSGSHTPIRKFIYELRGVVDQQALPGFALSIEQHDDGEHLVIVRTADEGADIDTCQSASQAEGLKELRLPPDFPKAVAQPPAGPPPDLSFRLEEPPEAPKPPPPLSFSLSQEPNETAPARSDPVALPRSPACTATSPEPRQRGVNTPLAIGRTRRNTYF